MIRLGAKTKMLLWLVGLAAIVLLARQVGWGEIWETLQLLTPGHIVLLAALQIVTLSLSAIQLWYVLRCGGIKLPFGRVLSIYMTGSLMESLTPSVKVGGEALKIHLLRRSAPGKDERLVGAFVTYKLLANIPLAVLIPLALCAFRPDLLLRLLPYTLGVGLGAVLLFKGLAILRRRPDAPWAGNKRLGAIGRFLRRSATHARYTVNRRQMGLMLLAGSVVWLLYPVKLAIVAAALGIDLSPLLFAGALIVSYVVSMLPLAPGGLGSFEGTFVLLLAQAGVPTPQALAAVLALRLFTYWFPMLPGAGFALYTLGVRREPAPRPQPTTHDVTAS